MYKLNRVRGFVALPIIIGTAVLSVGVLGGLAYEYKNNQSIQSSVNKNNLLAQVYVADSFSIISPSSGEQLTAGQTYNVRWSGTSGSNNFYSVYLIGGIDMSSWSLGTAYQTEKDVNSISVVIPSNVPTSSSYQIRFIGKAWQSDSNFFTITAPVVDTFSIISPSSGEQLTAGQTYNVRWSGTSGSNNFYSVYLIGGIDMSSWSLGTAYQTEKDVNSISVVIPSNVPTSSSYQIRFIGKAWQSDSNFFTITAPVVDTFSIISPSSGEQLTAGQTYNVRWSGTSGSNNFYSVYLIGGIDMSSWSLGTAYQTEKDVNSISVVIPSNVPTSSSYQIRFIGKAWQSDSNFFTITAPVVDTFSIISPSSGEQLTAGQTYNVRWSGTSGSNNFYSVYLIGGIDMSSWSLGTAYQTEKDVNSISVVIPSNVPTSSSYQIRFIGKAWQSDSNFFTITAPVVDTFSIISPSSGEQLTAGQTYNVRWSGTSGSNNFYSVYLIGGIDMSSWSLGTAYQTEKDVNSISVVIPSNVPTSSSYQIRFIGKAWQSDSNFFTITAPVVDTFSIIFPSSGAQ